MRFRIAATSAIPAGHVQLCTSVKVLVREISHKYAFQATARARAMEVYDITNVFTTVVCTMCNGCVCNGGPSGHMVPCHKVAAIPIHNQPFLHSDSTKVHSEKARTFLTVESTKMYAVYSIWECPVECTHMCVVLYNRGESQAPRINLYWLAKPFCGN